MSYLDPALRGMIIVVLAMAAGGKLAGREAFTAFAASLSTLGLGRRLARPAGVTTIAAEAVAAVLLAVPATTTAGLILAFGVLAAFAFGSGWAVARGRAVECRCFGAAGGVLGKRHIVRNVLLVLVVAAAFAVRATAGSVSGWPALPVLAAGGLLGLVVVRWDDLRYLIPRSDAW